MPEASRRHDRRYVLSDRLVHRAAAAFRAISARRSLDSFFARAGPPFIPPSFPRATAAGFLSLGLAGSERTSPASAPSVVPSCSTTRKPLMLGSSRRWSLLERSGISIV